MFKFIFIFVCLSHLLVAKSVRVDLEDNSSISGNLIKSTTTAVFVDVGFDIIKVPRSSVITLRYLEEKKPAPQEEIFTSELFINSPSNTKSSSLKNLVDVLGEAVVLIRTPIGLGSGFIIHPSGYLVTNDHVVAGDRQISVTQYTGSGAELTKNNLDNVKIIATGGNLDLALLKIESDKRPLSFPYVKLGSSPNLNQGERVFAIGSPLGLERSVSEGIVSLRNRIISDRLHIQTTAAISPGNSGGPLFNYKGEVIGVNNMKVVTQGAEGLGFAIPVDSLKTFLLNRDAYAFDPRNPNAGFRYTQPPFPN